MILKIALVALIAITASKAEYVSYENYKVYKVIPQNDEHVQKIEWLREQLYEFWTDVTKVGEDVRIMVSPEQNDKFVQYVRNAGMEPVLGISNVQELIRAQMRTADVGRSNTLGSFSWNRYHTLEEIHAWLDELPNLYPGVVTPITIGRSIEGRAIKGVVIDFKAENRGESTPLIGMLEGGIHAREWISPATVTWVIKEFLTSNNRDVRDMAENFVWHIFPVVNPDGYAYTFSNNRMWRKNRNPAYSKECSSVSNDLSNGIDLNRNFNYLWMTVGASNDSCTEVFAGLTGGSELETIAIANHVLRLQRIGKLIYYFAFHSYSQMTLVPFSHVNNEAVLEVPNYGDLYEIAIRGAEKLEAVHGTRYLVGTSADILYAVSGSSFDWVKGVAEVPIVYLFELRDVGEYGFLLPPEDIVPNNEEMMACLVEMNIATKELGYYYLDSGSSSIYASLVSLFVSALFILIVK